MAQMEGYYQILGKGSDGKVACGGYISIKKSSRTCYLISIYIDDIQNKSWETLDKKIVDERTVSFPTPDFTQKDEHGLPTWYDIVVQKCNVNPNVYYFVLPKLYGGKGTEIYKTQKYRG